MGIQINGQTDRITAVDGSFGRPLKMSVAGSTELRLALEWNTPPKPHNQTRLASLPSQGCASADRRGGGGDLMKSWS